MMTLKKENYLNDAQKIFIHKSYAVHSIQEHLHEFLEITYICEGQALHIINGKEYMVTKGDLFFLNFNVPHSYKSMTKDFCCIDCLFLPETLDESLIYSNDGCDLFHLLIFKPLLDNSIDFIFSINLLGHQKEFEYIFEDMFKEYTRKKDAYNNILLNYLAILLSKIFRFAAETNVENYSKNNRDILTGVLSYIQKNYSKKLTLEEISRQVLLSPSHFSAMFKRSTGYSLFEFIHIIRVEESCYLLTSTEKSICDIMNEVGYLDSKFFYQIFKKQTGMTPAVYRGRNK